MQNSGAIVRYVCICKHSTIECYVEKYRKIPKNTVNILTVFKRFVMMSQIR